MEYNNIARILMAIFKTTTILNLIRYAVAHFISPAKQLKLIFTYLSMYTLIYCILAVDPCTTLQPPKGLKLHTMFTQLHILVQLVGHFRCLIYGGRLVGV